MSVNIDQRNQAFQADAQRAEESVYDAMRYIFDEYDPDHDGFLARKEFFALLWKLKSESGYQLNEGQMIDCWEAVDPTNKGLVSFEEFKTGLEVIYDNFFFAVQNGMPVPETHYKFTDIGPDNSSYNTIRIKNSAAVALFDVILQEEKKQLDVETKQTLLVKDPRTGYVREVPIADATRSQRIRAEKAKATGDKSYVVKPPPISTARVSTPAREAREARESAKDTKEDHALTLVPRSRSAPSNESTPDMPPLAQAASSPAPSSSVSDNPTGVIRTTSLARPGFGPSQELAEERRKKKEESELELQRIMSQRHQNERRLREEAQKKKLEEQRRKSETEVSNMFSGPAWKQNLSPVTRNLRLN